MSGLREALRAVLRDLDREPTEEYLAQAERLFRASYLADRIHDAMPDENNWQPYFRVVDEPDGWWLEIRYTLSERIAAALLAEPVPPCPGCAVYHDLHHPDHVPGAEPVPLDVERLAAAAQDHETSGIHGPLHCSLACGATIAAEYARLTDLKGAEE